MSVVPLRLLYGYFCCIGESLKVLNKVYELPSDDIPCHEKDIKASAGSKRVGPLLQALLNGSHLIDSPLF